jgi:hypothetical protein
MTVVREMARNLIRVQGIFLDKGNVAIAGQLRRVGVFIVDFGSDGLEIYKLRYKGGRQIPNQSLKEENEHVR